MQSLSEVIRALQAEIASSIAGSSPLPPGCRLVADRVVATLCFSVVSSPDDVAGAGPRFVVGTGQGAGHALRLEFAVRNGAMETAEPAISPNPGVDPQPEPEPVPLRGDLAESVVPVLSGVFGAPGFDSSARATVFREALEGLDAGGIRRLMEALGDGKSTGDRDVDHARHLVRRVIASGPGTVDDGVGALRGLFRKHDAADLVGLIGDRWRTQDDWLE